MKRQYGFYWVRLKHSRWVVALWNGREWMLPMGTYYDKRVFKVSERLTPPTQKVKP